MSTIANICDIEQKPTKLSPRIEALKNDLLARKYETDIDRAMHFTRVYKRTEGMPVNIRAAMGLMETLRNMPIKIRDGERIVGSKSSKDWGSSMYLEKTAGNMYAVLSSRFYKSEKTIAEVYPEGVAGVSAAFLEKVPNLTEEEYRELTEEILPYWQENCAATLWENRLKDEGLYSTNDTIIMLQGAGQGHITLGIDKVLRLGFNGIAAEAQKALEQLDTAAADYEKRKDFLEAVQLSAEAACVFAGRYADLAEEMAKSAEPARKQELLQIADRCRAVPAEPPRSFIEAVQAVWMTQAVALIAYGDNAIIAAGRVDQFVYPFYKKDIEAGMLTRDEALEIIEEYSIQISTNIYFGPNNVTIGGVDRQGNNAVNDVSFLFLEAHKNLGGMRNGLAVRQSESTPKEFLRAACELHRTVAGLAFYNDDVVIRDLMRDGYTLEAARNYSIVGCVEPTGTGDNNGYTGGNGLWAIAILEMALNGGRKSDIDWGNFAKNKEKMMSANRAMMTEINRNDGSAGSDHWPMKGAKTPPPGELKSFEDVKAAFLAQLEYTIDRAQLKAYYKDQVIAENYPVPFVSSLVDGCIESGKDFTNGGALFNHSCITSQGIATIADSLTAIKWAVFDKKLVGMGELVEHLNRNFEGAEELRQQLINAPKYGNDDPYADEIALWVVKEYSDIVMSKPFWMGGVHRGCFISALSQVTEGALCAATPDGRLAGTPVSNGLSPSNKSDAKGMTAALQSAATVSAPSISDGTSVNITFNPSILKTDEAVDKFAATLEGYFALGGRQVQFNPISAETLLDAQKNPEKYMGLNVKVSGFSMRFIDLPTSIQDDIVARTQYEAM